MVTPAAKREAVAHLKSVHEMSERRACRMIGCQRMTVRYRQRRRDDAKLRERLVALARERRRFGYRRLLIFLRREGFVVNHKRLFRLYREERLMVRKRGGRKRAVGTRAPMPVPALPNDLWVLDFVSDQLVSGRRFRILAISDVCTRRCLVAIADFSLSGKRVARARPAHRRPRQAQGHRQRQRYGADQQRHPGLDRPDRRRLALHRPRQARPERLLRELQRPPARRVPERDAVHLARPGTLCARGMAARLQHRASPFAHRLADAGRLHRAVLITTGPRRCARDRLRALPPCHRSDRGVQPPDSSCPWIKVGGNVSRSLDLFAR
jgi:putative transposase